MNEVNSWSVGRKTHKKYVLPVQRVLLATTGDVRRTLSIYISYFSYGYIIFYAIMGGSLVFYGIEKMNSFIKRFIKHTEFASLVSVTFIIFCCFIYSALFKDILQGITGQAIEINEWDNVIGFLVGRIAIIAILYISFVK